jgi:hypothetical protein
VPDYRLYLLDPHSGHIDSVEMFHSGDDVEAICLVDHRVGPVPSELWCGARKVCRFDAVPQAAAMVRAPAGQDRVSV